MTDEGLYVCGNCAEPLKAGVRWCPECLAPISYSNLANEETHVPVWESKPATYEVDGRLAVPGQPAAPDDLYDA